ncbi:TetR/AcrR family transcriptional regulator [Agromyces seonyuensis]|uniref:TetR family transcriptional regulator n=1 Tax=Agromyces seonyuensis TaxID=2662446 RepID=A0A6I4P496_9MICO|nr:TetR/AcrR family transcriptional regulator [Agromyces seonyuensis]MWB98257.1 TetR family transcriptional regulator [Agromyces seonyuensis]
MPSDTDAAPRAQARAELLVVALEQFAVDGYHATSLQQIADRAGYAKSNVLYHFGSKEGLLNAALSAAVDDLAALVDTFPRRGAGVDPREFVERFVDYLFAHRLEVVLIVNQGQSLADVPVVDRAMAVIARLALEICSEDASIAEQLRFGVALAGAAYTLVAGRTILGGTLEPEDGDAEARTALVDILAELLAPAARPLG